MDSKVRLRLCLAYDGNPFYGWQKQPNQPATVQGQLETALSKIYNQPIAVVGSGRTDRGVHALNQWAHFDLPSTAQPDNLHYKLQRMSSDAIQIKDIQFAPTDFHAQISAVSKCYLYKIQVAPSTTPFFRHFSWQRKAPLSLNYLQEASKSLLGSHDFTSFQSQGTPVSSPVRKIEICRWVCKKNNVYEFQIKGNGFLKQMVRNIVGSLILAHDNGQPPSQIQSILNERNRQSAAAPAPAQGLFLSSVQYPQNLDNKCRKL